MSDTPYASTSYSTANTLPSTRRSGQPALRIDASSTAYSHQYSTAATADTGSSSPTTYSTAVEVLDDALEAELTKNVDPLDLYHRHMLESNPHLDESIATDDDLLNLLRTAKDRTQLKWIEDAGLPLSAHPTKVIFPPWRARPGQEPNASVLTFDSPTSSTSSSARDSPEAGFSEWRRRISPSPATDSSILSSDHSCSSQHTWSSVLVASTAVGDTQASSRSASSIGVGSTLVDSQASFGDDDVTKLG